MELQARFEKAAGSASKTSGTSKRLATGRAGGADSKLRLLRLLSKHLFADSRYTELRFQARGTFGNVFRAKMLPANSSECVQQVIVKTIPLPTSCYDRCIIPDMYGEISVMEKFKVSIGVWPHYISPSLGFFPFI
jgi:hypothetical protein